MFEKFTDRARRVVVLAQEEARLLNHNAIGTEHLLLGIVHEGQGVAAQTLQALDIRLAAVRNAIEREAPRGASVKFLGWFIRALLWLSREVHIRGKKNKHKVLRRKTARLRMTA